MMDGWRSGARAACHGAASGPTTRPLNPSMVAFALEDATTKTLGERSQRPRIHPRLGAKRPVPSTSALSGNRRSEEPGKFRGNNSSLLDWRAR